MREDEETMDMLTNDDECAETDNSILNFCNRSGLQRILTEDKNFQTDPCDVEKPAIRTINFKNNTEKIKSLCARLSADLAISPEKARKAVKIVCEQMYGYKYYLSVEEALKGKYYFIRIC